MSRVFLEISSIEAFVFPFAVSRSYSQTTNPVKMKP